MQDLPALRAYAVRVAGTVGAMMAVLMGVRDPERLAAAVDLGVAMQLSNIARDVGEDARNGRLYLPLDWLARGRDRSGRLSGRSRHIPRRWAAWWGGCWTRRSAIIAEPRAGIARLPLGLPVRHRRGWRCCMPKSGGRWAAAAWTRCPAARWCRIGARSGCWRPALPGWRCRCARCTASACRRAYFLVDAVVQATPADRRRPVPPLPWWDVAERLRWTIDLFERLEQRERVQP